METGKKGTSSWGRRGFVAVIWQGRACHLPGQGVYPSCPSFVDLVHPKWPMPWAILLPLREQPHRWVSLCNPFSPKQLMPAPSLSKLHPGLWPFISDRTFPVPFNPSTSSSWLLPLDLSFPTCPGLMGEPWKSSWSVQQPTHGMLGNSLWSYIPAKAQHPQIISTLFPEQTHCLMPPGLRKLLWVPLI